MSETFFRCIQQSLLALYQRGRADKAFRTPMFWLVCCLFLSLWVLSAPVHAASLSYGTSCGNPNANVNASYSGSGGSDSCDVTMNVTLNGVAQPTENYTVNSSYSRTYSRIGQSVVISAFSNCGGNTNTHNANCGPLSGTPTPVATPAPSSFTCDADSILFSNANITSSDDDSGSGNVEFLDSGCTLKLTGDKWQHFTNRYDFNANSVITFEYMSDSTGEIHGMQFDSATAPAGSSGYQFHGDQNWSNTNTSYSYTGNGSYQDFSIPVGQNYTGNNLYWMFVSDDDRSSPNNTSHFRNVKFYENGIPAVADTTAPIVSITNAPAITLSNQASYTTNGSCTNGDGNVTVAISGATPASQTVSCSGGSWSASFDLSSLAGGGGGGGTSGGGGGGGLCGGGGGGGTSGGGGTTNIDITASQTDSAGNTGSDTASVNPDSNAPVVVITTRPSATVANQGTYTISGSCSNGDGDVTVAIDSATPASQAVSCVGSSWSATFDVSASLTAINGGGGGGGGGTSGGGGGGGGTACGCGGGGGGTSGGGGGGGGGGTACTISIMVSQTDSAGNTGGEIQALPTNTATPTPTPVPSSFTCDADAILFSNANITSSDDDSGSGNVEFLDSGCTLKLTGDKWQHLTSTYDLNANSVIVFEYMSDSTGEIHGMQFDSATAPAGSSGYQFHGDQNWSNTNTSYSYTGNGSYQDFSIPVGQDYTGNNLYWMFVNDDDRSSPSNTAYFRNVKFYENGIPTASACTATPQPLGNSDFNSFENASWRNSNEAQLLPSTISNWAQHAGHVVSKTRIDFTQAWDLDVDIYLASSGHNHGLGIAFHNDPTGASGFGSPEGSLGITDLQNAIGIEFDANGLNAGDENNQDHIAIVKPGSSIKGIPQFLGGLTIVPSGALNTDQYHNVKISWDPSIQQFGYRFNGGALQSVSRDVISLDLNSNYAHFSITGAGYDGTEQRLRFNSFCGSSVAGLPPYNPNPVSYDPVANCPTLPAGNTLLNTTGNASWINPRELQLTPEGTWGSGNANSQTRIDFSQDWTFTFDAYLGTKPSGADGLSFILHNDSRGSTAQGFSEGSLGITGLSNAIGVEFDTFDNSYNEPNENPTNGAHSAIVISPTTDINPNTPPIVIGGIQNFTNLENDQYHRVEVNWDASAQQFSYTINGNTHNVTRDIINQDLANSSLAYWGFAASTGSKSNDQRIYLHGFCGRMVDSGGDDVINTNTPTSTPTPGLVGFEIEPLELGTNCHYQPIRIRACQDNLSPCTPLSNYTGTVDLRASTNFGGWGTTYYRTNRFWSENLGTLSSTGYLSGGAQYQFATADQGETILGYWADFNSSNRSAYLTVTEQGVSSPLTARSRDIWYANRRMFRINPHAIYHNYVWQGTSLAQIVGRPTTLHVQADRQYSSSCVVMDNQYGRPNATGNVSVKVWLTRTEDDLGNALPTLNGSVLPTSEPNSTNYVLSVNEGDAFLTLDAVPDIVKFNLHIKDETQTFDSGIFQGSTGFPVHIVPFGFDINVDTDPSAANAFATSLTSGSIFKATGDNFTTSVRAVSWQAADDTDNDGVADIGADLSDNATVSSFEANRLVTEPLNLSHSVVLGPNGTLNGGLNLSDFNNGQATTQLSYSEESIIDLTINYQKDHQTLNSEKTLATHYSENINGELDNVGRFGAPTPTPAPASLSCIATENLSLQLADAWDIANGMIGVGFTGTQTQRFTSPNGYPFDVTVSTSSTPSPVITLDNTVGPNLSGETVTVSFHDSLSNQPLAIQGFDFYLSDFESYSSLNPAYRAEFIESFSYLDAQGNSIASEPNWLGWVDRNNNPVGSGFLSIDNNRLASNYDNLNGKDPNKYARLNLANTWASEFSIQHHSSAGGTVYGFDPSQPLSGCFQTPLPTPPSFTCDDDAIDFTDAVQTFGNPASGGDTNDGTVEVLDNGCTLKLAGNRWQSFIDTYNLTNNSVIEFEYMSEGSGEIQGLGFASDSTNTPSSSQAYKLYGNQSWGNTSYNYTETPGQYQSFSLPIGQIATGNDLHWFFANDNDADPSVSGSNSYFRNVKFHPFGVEPDGSPTPGFYGFQVEVLDQFSECDANHVEIRACQDTLWPCTIYEGFTGTVNLGITQGRGVWTEFLGGLGTGYGIKGTAPDYGGWGDFQHPSVTWEQATFGTTGHSTRNGISSYTFVAADLGRIRLGYEPALDSRYPTQAITVSGSGRSAQTPEMIPFDSGQLALGGYYKSVVGRPITVNVKLWRSVYISPTWGGQTCSPLDESSTTNYSTPAVNGNTPVKIWLTRGPEDNGLNPLPTLNGQALPTSMPSSNNTTLNFVSGELDLVFDAVDNVVQFDVHIRDDSGTFAFNSSPRIVNAIHDGVYVGDTVVPVNVKPFGFDVNVNADSNATNAFATNLASGTFFKNPNEDFPVEVRAVAWQAADDADNDSVPDAGADLSDNTTVLGFGHEKITETVTLTHSNVAGTGGSLVGDTLVTGFNQGRSSTNLQYDTLGIIDITAGLTDANYLDAFGTVSPSTGLPWSTLDINGLLDNLGVFGGGALPVNPIVNTDHTTDTDGDGVPDVIDLDDDGDGIPDTTELAVRSFTVDTDNDGALDDNTDLLVVAGWYHNFPLDTTEQDAYATTINASTSGFEAMRAGSGGTWASNNDPSVQIPNALPPGANGNYINQSSAARGYETVGTGINADLVDGYMAVGSATGAGARSINSGINQNDYASAVNDNDYLEYTFTTADSFANNSEVYFAAITASDLNDNPTTFDIALAISVDDFTNSETLLEGHTFAAGIHTRVIDLGTPYQFAPANEYKVRVYFYNIASNQEIVFDNFQVAIKHYDQRHSDNDGLADHRDLDSDNDALNDVFEAGSLTDTDGNGLADGVDNNNDGIIDSFNANPLDSDVDGYADYRDLDSDDASETVSGNGVGDDLQGFAAFDSDNNGQIDYEAETDLDGIMNAVDGAVTLFGDASGSIGSPVTGTDFDSDGIPDVLDRDDDNDGIPDITELAIRTHLVDADSDGDIDDSTSLLVVAGWFHDFAADPLAQDAYATAINASTLNFNTVRNGSGGTWGTSALNYINIPSALPPGAHGGYINLDSNARGREMVGAGLAANTQSDNAAITSSLNTVFGTDTGDALTGVRTLDSGFEQSTLANAVLSADFLEYSFTTAQRFDLDSEVYLSAITATDFGVNSGDVDLAVVVSADHFSTSATLLEDQTFSAGGGNQLMNLLPYQLEENTEYQVRVYFYNPSHADSELVFDDFQIAIQHFDTRHSDQDSLADHRDLDADNDSINDVIEAGSLSDLDGNGLADGTDSNNDGIIDSFNSTPLDSDGDNYADYRDVDSNDASEHVRGDGVGDDIAATDFEPFDKDLDGQIDVIFDADQDGITSVADGDPNNFGDAFGLVGCIARETLSLSLADNWDSANGKIGVLFDGSQTQTFTSPNGYPFEITVSTSSLPGSVVSLDNTVGPALNNQSLTVSFAETQSDQALNIQGFEFYVSDLESRLGKIGLALGAAESLESFSFINAQGMLVPSEPTWNSWVDKSGNTVGNGDLQVIDQNLGSNYSIPGSLLFTPDHYAHLDLSSQGLSQFSFTIDTHDALAASNGSVAGFDPNTTLLACFKTPLPELHGFNIRYDGNPNSCDAGEVVITACEDNANPCKPLTNYTGSVDLTSSLGLGTWSAAPSYTLHGSLSNAGVDNGQAQYQFAVEDNGEVRLRFNHTAGGALQLSATQTGTLNPKTQSTEPLNFLGRVLQLTSTDPQVVGKPIAVTASVLRQGNSGTCGLDTAYNGSATLKAWITRHKNDASGDAPSIQDLNNNTISLPDVAPSLGHNLALNFTDGVAAFHLNTTDIGQYQLNLRDDSFALVNESFEGSSQRFTLRPFGLALGFNSDPNGGNALASDATGSAFAAAGADFEATVRAIAWQASDDANNDGLPDIGANLNDNTTIGGFGREAQRESVRITHSFLQPAGGTVGTLSGGDNINHFTLGIATPALQYSEVGIIDLQAELVDQSYLDTGVNLIGEIRNVGRFIPAYLNVTAESVDNACNSAGSPFTYIGQPFPMSYELTAYNTQAQVTQNYTAAFSKLNLNSANNSRFHLGLDNGALDLTGRLMVTNWNGDSLWSQGVGTASGYLILNRNTAEAPLNNIIVSINPIDADGVRLQSAALNINADGFGGADHRSIGLPVELIYGRARINNGYGSELLSVDMKITLEHYREVGNGQFDFVPHENDNCTQVGMDDIGFESFEGNLGQGHIHTNESAAQTVGSTLQNQLADTANYTPYESADAVSPTQNSYNNEGADEDSTEENATPSPQAGSHTEGTQNSTPTPSSEPSSSVDEGLDEGLYGNYTPTDPAGSSTNQDPYTQQETPPTDQDENLFGNYIDDPVAATPSPTPATASSNSNELSNKCNDDCDDDDDDDDDD